ncbi:probable N-acetyltransferase 14 [Marmota marmota marmota]|uniref:probable N-acetyltransferase 14 n=1 Tax=Marmota marmota marmota TaxID=9994 RepID=UPI002092EDEA|nr:probable N-acetyltransferase 14 [Marmota marmota marmota]XP_048647640.1 probable N-acetyltransferase 14 [Marmota marmota marmota]XP_048647641.1 probable N-acetyltransferase 14 [Marmota marmota marmota]
MAPSHLSVREMREDEKALVLEMLKAGVKDTENRVALHALTRPPALLLLAAASSGLRFVLASFALALLLPVFLAVAAVKLGLRAWWGSLPPPGGLGGPWVAVRGSGDVCGVLALAPGTNAGDGARVTRLSVSRWHRRRGVGRRLLAFAESRARAWAGGMGAPREPSTGAFGNIRAGSQPLALMSGGWGGVRHRTVPQPEPGSPRCQQG